MILGLGITLTQSQAEFNRLLLDEAKIVLDKAIDKSLPAIDKYTKFMIDKRMRASPEFSSLISGVLEAEFGLSDTVAISTLDAILADMKDSVKVIKIPLIHDDFRFRSGGVLVTAVNSNFKRLLDVDGASYVSYGHGKAWLVDWLNWLLTKGLAVILPDFQIDYNLTPRETKWSRSGKAVMRNAKQAENRGITLGYKVPSQFAGTRTNNWITKALFGLDVEICDFIGKTIQSKL